MAKDIKVKQIGVRITERLLQRIDALAECDHTNRSGVVTKAVIELYDRELPNGEIKEKVFEASHS